MNEHEKIILEGPEAWNVWRENNPGPVSFARPDNLSLLETVVTMACLSKFVVADLSGASVPAELQGTLS